MGILDQIRKTAHNAAREGLERLGVTLKLPHDDIPDDEDTKSKDLIDIYSSIFDKKTPQEPVSVPIPADHRNVLRELAAPLCANHKPLMDTIETWFEDRRSIFPDTEPSQSFSLDEAKQELNEVLKQLHVIQKIEEAPDKWLKTAQSISRVQNSNIQNLLLQTSRQFESETFIDWMTQMNERIERFHVTIVQIDDFMGIKPQ